MELRITTLIASGDFREALRLLCEAYGAAVGRYCTGLVGSRAEAEELLQEALIEAYAAMGRFRGESTARAWLFGIARRLCIRHLRRRDRRLLLFRRFARQAPEEATEDHERSDARLALERALVGLKPPLRDAVLLQYQAGLEGPEIAAVLGITAEAARKRVSLGVQALRVALRPNLMVTDTNTATDTSEAAHGHPAPVPATHSARILGS